MLCNICGADSGADVEVANVRSNVRMFANELFAVWRCPTCLSIHARDEVDLAHYYRHYPFHHGKDAQVEWTLKAAFRNLFSRLKAAGLEKQSSILDYGCGNGQFFKYARSIGYENAHGYDAYSEHFTDTSVLSHPYDCVMAQDVIEHVPDPQAFVREIHALTRPGGLIALGTPNAEDIDLQHVEKRVHALHQPYHRNILSKRALQTLGKDLGWELVRYFPSMYINTFMPCVNASFVQYYFESYDNNCDLSTEPVSLKSLRMWSPVALAHAFLGSLWAPECDVMVVFRRK